MSSALYPIIGNWYRGQNQLFEVVAMDEAENLIEIQYFGGDIDEMDFEGWNSLSVENAAPPEDWSGAYDVEPDDFGFSDLGSGMPGSGQMSLKDFD